MKKKLKREGLCFKKKMSPNQNLHNEQYKILDLFRFYSLINHINNYSSTIQQNQFHGGSQATITGRIMSSLLILRYV